MTPARYSAVMLNQRDDLVRQNLSYQQELANLKARVMFEAFVDFIAFLVVQFQENAAIWGREKVELLSKINDIDAPVSARPARSQLFRRLLL